MIHIGVNLTSQYQIYNFLSASSCFINFSNSDKRIVFIKDYWNKNTISNEWLDKIKKKFNVEFIFEPIESRIGDFIKYDDGVVYYSVNSMYKKGIILNKKKKFVIVDDGIGSYTGFSQKIKGIIREKGYLKLLRWLLVSLIDRFFCRLFKVQRIALYDQDLSLNADFLEQWHFNDAILFNGVKVNDKKKKIIFCSQPLYELGLISREDFFLMFNHIKEFYESNGFIFLVKKHPVESDDKYLGCNSVLSCDILEHIAFQQGVETVIGFNSTSLININALYGINSVYINSSIYNSMSILSPRQKKMFDMYCNEFYIKV